MSASVVSNEPLIGALPDPDLLSKDLREVRLKSGPASYAIGLASFKANRDSRLAPGELPKLPLGGPLPAAVANNADVPPTCLDLRSAAAALPTDALDNGAEHVVLFPPGDRVRKYAIAHSSGSLGYSVAFSADGAVIGLRRDLPPAYLKRLSLFNHFFGDDIAVIGSVRDSRSGQPSIVTQQRFIDGRYPSPAEARDWMLDHGFLPALERRGDRLVQSSYDFIRPDDGFFAGDAKARNFIKTRENGIVPIDLMVGYPENREVIVEQARKYARANGLFEVPKT